MRMTSRSLTSILCVVILLMMAGCIRIQSFHPPGGPAGTEVLVKGTGFSAALDGNQVTIAGHAAQVLSATSTELLIEVPAGIERGKIKICRAWGNCGESVYDFIPMPRYLEYHRFKSASLSETAGSDIIRPYWIMYPPSFHVDGARFPVVYALHGYNGKRNGLRTEMGQLGDDLGFSTLANYDENSWLFAADLPGLYLPIIAYTLMECSTPDEFLDKIGPRLREVAGAPDIDRIPEIVQAIMAYMPHDPPNWLETLHDMIIIMPAADNSWYSNRLGPPERRNPQGIGRESIFPRNGGENPENRLDLFVTGWHEKYIMNDLPEEITTLIGEEKLAPLPKRQFIMGVSMGGFGAMKLALRDPGSFAAAAELAGPLDMRTNSVQLYLFNRYAPEFIDVFGSAPLKNEASMIEVRNRVILDRDSLAANNPLCLAKQMPMNSDGGAPDFFLEIGENDILEFVLSGTKQATLDIIALLQAKNLYTEGGIIPGADHNGRGGHHPDFWRTRFSHIFKFFSEAYDRR